MHKHKTLSVLSMLLFIWGTASATIWYVHPDSIQNCIQDCLDACSASDTVFVGAGTYYENIVWPTTDGIVLMSEYGRDTTIIDGGHADPVIYALLADSSTVISGFTIQNGYGGVGYEAGGIYLTNCDKVRITNNIITNNTGIWSGGISCLHSNPVITENIIRDNTCDTAGGGIMYISAANPTISDNEISFNYARWAGGIYVTGASQGTILGNHIHHNTATIYGGGVGIAWSSGGILKHNIIEHNQANWGYGGGIYFYNLATPAIDSCDITNNTEGIYNSQLNSTPTIHYCNITDNIGFAARSISTTIDCEHNWWGHATGPYHPNTNPGGLGDTVSNNVDFDPWLGIAEFGPDNATITQLQVYPNPFSGTIQIRYEIRDAGCEIQDFSLQIYDINGRLVKSFNTLSYAPCPTQISWDGSDTDGNRLPSGVYFLKLQGGEYNKTAKLLLVR